MSFETALAFTLAREGGLVDDPRDPGGRTNLGVTQHELDAVRSKYGLPATVDALTPQLVAPLYRGEYWQAAKCDGMAPALGLAVFDTAVNMGVDRARQLLATGIYDVEDYLWNRLAIYQQIPGHRPASLAFLPGWLKRMLLLRRTIQEGRV